jgi:lipopolysaccharide transport system permease protein
VPKPAPVSSSGRKKISTVPATAGEGKTSPPEPIVTIDASRVSAMALTDLRVGLLRRELWLNFALHDIRQRFRRSMLGPFWITISTAVMIAALALVFGTIFQAPSNEFIPYLATGLIFWGFITTSINEGCHAFIAGSGYIRSVPMPMSVHFYRSFARDFIILLHNMVILVVVFAVFQRPLSPAMLLFIPGFLLFCGVLASTALIAGILSARFRDIPQLITNVLQVIFFLTPIFWSVELLPNHVSFLTLNPIYHLIQIVRAPLLGHYPSMSSWIAVSVMLVVGIAVAFYLYRRAYPRLAYWV